MNLREDICIFLQKHGIEFTTGQEMSIDVINVSLAGRIPNQIRTIIPVPLTAGNASDAVSDQQSLSQVIKKTADLNRSYPLIITEDRWKRMREMMEKRLLAHLEIFFPVYARNCIVKRIDKATAGNFLKANHTYGDAVCRYRYGLYLKRHTGHIAKDGDAGTYVPGTLVAVATFSNARRWEKGERTIRSYEWTRYASLPELRVNGGMGKLLKAFIDDVHPDDIMSYSDLEWSEGSVYEKLGFSLEEIKDPIGFIVDNEWRRRPIKMEMKTDEQCMPMGKEVFFCNQGSRKYRLKITEYD